MSQGQRQFSWLRRTCTLVAAVAMDFAAPATGHAQEPRLIRFRTTEAQPVRASPSRNADYLAVLDVNSEVFVPESLTVSGDFVQVATGQRSKPNGWVIADQLRLDPSEVRRSTLGMSQKDIVIGEDIPDSLWFGTGTVNEGAAFSQSKFSDRPRVEHFTDAPWAMLSADYTLGIFGAGLTLRKGFTTDYASVPRYLRFLFSREARFSVASIVHDYLYWVQQAGCSRQRADEVLSRAMLDEGLDTGEAAAFFLAVRLGGKSAWANNAREKRNGWIKLVAAPWDTVPTGTSWRRYRKSLFDRKVHDGIPTVIPRLLCRQ